MMLATTFFWLTVGQACLLLGMLLSVLLKPQEVLGEDQSGVSNYALQWPTVVPFSAGLGLCALATIAAAVLLALDHRHRPVLLGLLTFLAVLFLATLASAYVYKRNALLHKLHFIVGGLLIGYEAVFALWLLVFIRWPFIGSLGLAVQLAGVVLCVLSLRNMVRRLFFGEVIASAGFTVVLLSVLYR